MSATTDKSAATPALIDVHRVAKLLGCSDRHIYRLADSGLMPRPVKLDALVRWNRLAIETWLAQGCPPVEGMGKALRDE